MLNYCNIRVPDDLLFLHPHSNPHSLTTSMYNVHHLYKVKSFQWLSEFVFIYFCLAKAADHIHVHLKKSKKSMSFFNNVLLTCLDSLQLNFIDLCAVVLVRFV